MQEPFGPMRVVVSAVAAGLAGGLVVAAAVLLAPGRGPVGSATLPDAAASPTPAMDYLETFRCPRGLTRQVTVLGVEDNFARGGAEPSRIAPNLMQLGTYQDLAARKPHVLMLRDYDEGGTDKLLIDHVTVPGGTITGELVVKLRPAGGGTDSDYIRLQSREPGVAASATSNAYGIALSQPELRDLGPQTGSVRVANLADLQAIPLAPWPNLLRELADTQRDLEVTLTIQDDSVVDMAALALCVEPQEAMGLTFAEHSAKPAGPEISVLSCSLDETQGLCGPYQGDTPCTQSLPLACYREGGAVKPDSLATKGLDEAKFVPGTVQLTEPVRGSSLATRDEADKACATRFGAGARVLRYQEAGGNMVISRSAIAAKTRAWIDIPDQPRATCWSRPARGAQLE